MNRSTLIRFFVLFLSLWFGALAAWNLFPSVAKTSLSILFTLRQPVFPPKGVAIIDIQAARKGALKNIQITEIENCDWTNLDVNTGPWPRCAYAPLIRKLNALGAVVISFDISFASEGRESDNQVMADEVKKSGNVILLEKTDSELNEDLDRIFVTPVNKVIRNDALGRAPFVFPKTGSVFSYWAQHGILFDGLTLPALTLYAFESITSAAKKGKTIENDIHLRVRALLESGNITQDDNYKPLTDIQKRLLTGPGERYFNFYGGPGTLPIYSGLKVLNGTSEPDLTGLAVFVGQAELDTFHQTDSFLTVYSGFRGVYHSGVELAGTAYLNLMHDDGIRRLSPLISLLLLLGTAFLFTLAVYRLNFWNCALAIGTFVLAYAFLTFNLFAYQNIWIPTISVILFQMTVSIVMAYRRRTKLLKETGDKVVPDWGKQYVPTEENRAVRYDTVHAVCLRSDLSGYTRLGHKLQAGETHDLMNDYFAWAKAIIDKGKGNFAHPADDSYLAFWPIDDDKEIFGSAYKACRAALEGAKAAQIKSSSGEFHELHARIGLSFGEIAVGSVGDENAIGFNITGNTINLTARIESSNKSFGTKVLCDASLGDLDDQLLSRPIGRFLLRDQIEPKDLIEIFDIKSDASPAKLKLVSDFAVALSSFQNREYQKAHLANSETFRKPFPMMVRRSSTLNIWRRIQIHRTRRMKFPSSDWTEDSASSQNTSRMVGYPLTRH